MRPTDENIPIVSKPPGNVDECNLLTWLNNNHPKAFSEPALIKDVKFLIENENGYYLITPYLTPQDEFEYLKVRVKWELTIDNRVQEIWTTLYTTVPCPEDQENVRQIMSAKAKVMMVARTYCEYLLAMLNPGHFYHSIAMEHREIFQLMKHFLVETTTTGRVKSFKITTNETMKNGRNKTYSLTEQSYSYDMQRFVNPYFKVDQINLYESKALIRKESNDSLHRALTSEKAGHLNTMIIDYYNLCGNRYCQTFDEAYHRFIDVIADDWVQKNLQELKDMEAGMGCRHYSIQEIRDKFYRIKKHVKKHHDIAENEYQIMQDCYRHIQDLIDKFDSWRVHPEISLAQTSLLENKISDLLECLGKKRFLMAELKGRYEGIAFWTQWFREQFPTLFNIIDE